MKRDRDTSHPYGPASCSDPFSANQETPELDDVTNAAQQHHAGGFMRRAKTFCLELTKEQQALVLQKNGKEAKELEVTVDELERRTAPKPERAGGQP
jgi:hypothetical protein